VWIEDDLNDSQKAPGLKSAEQFGKSNCGIGNFAKDGNQDRAVEAIGGEPAVTETSSKKYHVFLASSLRLGSCSGKHSGLDVQRNNAAGGANALGQGNCQAPRAAPSVKNRHAMRQRESFDNESSPVRLREWIVQFYEPTQPDWARETLAT